jgi:hypothetical protein
MNGRHSIRKVPPTGGVTQGARLLAVQIILFVAVFCLAGQPALAKHNGHKKGPKNCTKMSNYAFIARQSEIRDDYFIAVGKCYNLPPEEDIKDCIRDAKAEEKDAKEEARDQRDARLDLCDQVGQGPYNPDIESMTFFDPGDINAKNANPYFPLVPGYKWTYKSRDENGEDPQEVLETNTVEVLDTKAPAVESVEIEGIPCAVVHDIVYKGDSTKDEDITEDTYDYYAQQDDGTVWYMGEFSLAKEECDDELCQGLWGDEGSWQAGFDGGKPGILMYPDTDLSDSSFPGTVYRQELYLGDAEDAAEVINFDKESVTVPYGDFPIGSQLLKTKDFSPLEPGVGDYKYYAPGIGVILEEAYEDDITTGERNELVSTGDNGPTFP